MSLTNGNGKAEREGDPMHGAISNGPSLGTPSRVNKITRPHCTIGLSQRGGNGGLVSSEIGRRQLSKKKRIGAGKVIQNKNQDHPPHKPGRR